MESTLTIQVTPAQAQTIRIAEARLIKAYRNSERDVHVPALTEFRIDVQVRDTLIDWVKAHAFGPARLLTDVDIEHRLVAVAALYGAMRAEGVEAAVFIMTARKLAFSEFVKAPPP